MNSEFYGLIYAYLYVVFNVKNRISDKAFGLPTLVNKTTFAKKVFYVLHLLINAHLL